VFVRLGVALTIIEINTDSEVWIQTKHALREAGYKSFLQPNLFDNTRANLFLERRAEDPEGKMSHGFIVFDGGCQVGSTSERAVDPYVIEEKPAAKSSTSVLNATVCQLCGHKMDGKSAAEGSQSFAKDGTTCKCGCHR
jgi:hypothetical protein